MNKIYILIMCLCLFVGSTINASQIGTRIDLGETAINLFLNEQYNRAGFKRQITGNTSGVSYDITLQLPYVRLYDNQVKVCFGFKISSNVFNGVIEFEDNLSINVASVENLTLQGVSTAFKDKVNSLNINNVLKSAIITAWDSLKLEVYPLLLAEQANESLWFAERAISIVSPYFSANFKFLKGKLQVILNTHLNANEYYQAGLIKEGSMRYLQVKCGAQVDVKEANLYSTDGQLLQQVKNAGTCSKNGVLKIPFGNLWNTGYYVVKILFKTNDTFYVRNYTCLFSSSSFFNPLKSIN